MVQLNKAYDKIKELGAELLAVHVECSEAGTRLAATRNNLTFPMANDDRLRVVDKYSPTSTYLIDRHGVIRTRWLDSIHERVAAERIVEELVQLRKSDGRPSSLVPGANPNRN